MSTIEGLTANLTVNDLTINQADVYVQTNGNPGMLLVHASWCGHCVNFKPVYQEICKKLNDKSTRFPCLAIESAQLEGSNGSKLSSALKIDSFPTLFFFDQSGKIIGKYNGRRDKSSILDNVCKIYHYCVNK